METLTQEQLVIRLIRDHLISTKLVSGLKILLGNSEKVKKINFSSDTEDLDKLSEEIYCELVFAKNMM